MYFLEARREERNKIEAVSWIKKMTEFLGKVRKNNNNKLQMRCVVLFFFSEWDNFLEDFSGITRKCKILTVIKLVKILTEIRWYDR